MPHQPAGPLLQEPPKSEPKRTVTDPSWGVVATGAVLTGALACAAVRWHPIGWLVYVRWGIWVLTGIFALATIDSIADCLKGSHKKSSAIIVNGMLVVTCLGLAFACGYGGYAWSPGGWLSVFRWLLLALSGFFVLVAIASLFAKPRVTEPTQPDSSAANQQARQARAVRVFISSTFRDMVEDRNELMSHVWPELRRLCQERHVELVEVDLRWGIAESQSTRRETLKLCLDEIRACRPFFIGLLGERYGWTPGDDAFTADLKEEQPWLKDLSGRSVTELEILHGVLNNPDMAGRAFFYFRDPKYVESVPVDKKTDFTAENAGSAKKQQQLKERIRAVCAKKNIPLRENYSDPRQLAAMVLTDFRTAIEAQFPKGNNPDALTREDQDHEAFAEIRRRTYIGRADYLAALDRHASSDGGPLLLLGDSGGGKSALLANWLTRWRTDHPKDCIVQHHIGGAPDSADHWRLMTRIIAGIKRWSGDPEALPATHDDLLKDFSLWLAKARARAARDGVHFIVVLDALNQLEDRDHARLLGWLPEHAFTGPLRLIVSTLPGKPGTDDTLEAARQRRWQELRVQPLTVEERGRMIAQYLARFGKKLDQPRLDRLASAPAAANPLYLKILLDDLRVTGTHDRLDQRVDDYLGATDVPALLRQVLARYERDYERERPGLIRDALGLIWAARRGLSEAELLRLLRPSNLPQLPPAIWTSLRAALDESLLDRGGILNFGHDFLRTAVEQTFAPDQDRQNKLRLLLADDFEAQAITRRSCDELLWLLWKLEERDRLRTCMLDIDRLLGIEVRDGEDLMRYWVWLGEERTMGKPYLVSFDAWSGTSGHSDTLIAHAANLLANFLSCAGLRTAAEPLLCRALAIREKTLGPDHPDVAESLNNQATIYWLQGQYAQAEPLFERALAILEKARGPHDPDVALALNNLALFPLVQRQYPRAESLLNRALAISEAALGAEHPDVSGVLGSLGRLYHAQGHYAQAELALKRALEIREKVFGPDHPNVGGTLSDLASLYRTLGQFAKAEAFYKRALDIEEKALGPRHPKVVMDVDSLAEVYHALGDRPQATVQYTRALSCREESLGPHHPEVAKRLNILGGLYRDQGQYAQAEPLMKRALTIREKALAGDHPDVATSLDCLAELYYAQALYAQAEPLLKRAFAIREKVLASDHPDLTNSLYCLATLYAAQGLYAQAEPLMRRTVQALLRVRGAKGDQLAQLQGTIDRYSDLLKKMGRSPEAVQGELSSLLSSTGIDSLPGAGPASSPQPTEAEVRAENDAIGNLIACGRSDEAYERAIRNVDLAKATGSDAIEGNCAFALGRAAHESGRLSAAILAYSRAAALAGKLGNSKAVNQIMVNLATAYLECSEGDRKDNLEKAIACQNMALETCSEASRPLDYAQLQFNMGAAYSNLIFHFGQPFHGQAVRCYANAARAFRALGMVAEWRNAEDASRQFRR